MDTQLIVRLVVSIITIINLLATQFGFNPLNIDESSIYTVVSTIAALAAWIWGFWKNNNFTEAAKKGQELTNELKAATKDSEASKE